MEAKDGSFGFDFAGTYTTIIPLELIEYVFGERTATVEFKQTSDGVTVQVSFVAETEHSIEQQQEGWQAILNRFAKHVASMVANHGQFHTPIKKQQLLLADGECAPLPFSSTEFIRHAYL